MSCKSPKRFVALLAGLLMVLPLAAADFPRRDRFLELHEQGRLVDPALPAARLADWLVADGVEPWAEERFTPA